MFTLYVGFFPSYAQNTFHFSLWECAFLFASYPFSVLIMCTTLSPLLPLLGRAILMQMGFFLAGMCSLLFGAGTTWWVLFVARCGQGMSASCIFIGLFGMVLERYADQTECIVGWIQSIIAIAFITAPSFGVALFEYGGYDAPFLTLAAEQFSMLLIVPIVSMELELPDGLKKQRREEEYDVEEEGNVEEASMWTPTTRMCWAVVCIAMMSFGFIDPTLGQHLQRTIGAQHTAVGLAFATTALAYGGVSGMLHHFQVRCSAKSFILLGLMCLVIGFIFLGPSPLLPSTFTILQAWIVQWLALLCLGSGAALCIAPAVSLSRKTVSETQLPHLVAAFAGAVYAGQAIGPLWATAGMYFLPTTQHQLCHVTSTISCESALPWVCTFHAFVLLVVCGLAWLVLPYSTTPLGPGTFTSIQRDAFVEYGQFVEFEA